MLIQEQGPPGSGKSRRLIQKANEAHAQGKRVRFLNWELSPEALYELGLHPDIPIQESNEVEALEIDD